MHIEGLIKKAQEKELEELRASIADLEQSVKRKNILGFKRETRLAAQLSTCDHDAYSYAEQLYAEDGEEIPK